MPVKSGFRPNVTADKWKRTCCALIGETRRRASGCTPLMATSPSWRAGLVCLSAAIPASASSIAGYTSARKSATHKKRRHRIVRGRRMLSHTVPVAKHLWHRSQTRQGNHAKITSQAVRSRVERHYHAVINVSRFATQETVVIASRLLLSSAGVAALPRIQFAIKARLKRLSVCAFAELC